MSPVNWSDPVNWNEDLNEGLIAWWLNVPHWQGGTTWWDLCGRHDGTLTNMDVAAVWQHTARTGGRGQLDFDGTNDYVDAGDFDDFSFIDGSADTPFSISLWVNRDVNSDMGLVDKYQGTDREWVFAFAGGDIWAIVFDQSGVAYRGRSVNNPNNFVPSGSWHHLVWTYDGGGLTSSTKIYIDAIQRDDLDQTFGATYVAMENLNQAVRLGSSSTLTGSFLNGKLDDVRIYDRYLSHSDIDGLKQEGETFSRRALNTRRSRGVSPGITAAVTGTATATIDEADVVAGAKTIIITLTGDTWVAAGASFNAQRQAIINGLDSAQVEATGWNAEVRDKEVVGAVVRTSDTVVTITLTAAGAYDITAQETITVTVPAAALVTSTSEVIATPTFTVDFVSVGSANLLRGKVHGGLLLAGKL